MQIVGPIENNKLVLMTREELGALALLSDKFSGGRAAREPSATNAPTHQRTSASAPSASAHSAKPTTPKKIKPPRNRPFGLPPQKWAPRPESKRNKACAICGTAFFDTTRTNTRKICDNPECKRELYRCSKHKRAGTGMSPADFRTKRIGMIKDAVNKANISITQ